MTTRDASVMIWQRKFQRSDAEGIQPPAQIQLAVPFGIPVREDHNSRTRRSCLKKSGVHSIIFSPGRNDAAGEGKDAPCTSAIFGRMQNVILRRADRKPVITVR